MIRALTAVLALSVAAFLVSTGVISVNLTHNVDLPINKQPYISCTGIFSKTCHVCLGSKTLKPRAYLELLDLLDTASYGDDITMYTEGYGGVYDTAVILSKSIKYSKANTTTVVRGGAYSAAAIITLSADNIVLYKDSILMLHIPAIKRGNDTLSLKNNEICNKAKGKDRGHPAVVKCKQLLKVMLNTHVDLMVANAFTALSGKEILAYMNGEDIYVTAETLKLRLGDKVRILQ